MASSRGRAKLAERQHKKYVFGSSTPRELTHMSIPPIFRAIDSKSQKEIAARSQSSASIMATSLLLLTKPQVNLAYYVRRAHHSQPPSKSSGTRKAKSFAFGSSTPREFSHLDRILPALRVYDAKVKRKKQPPVRSPSLNDTRKARSQSTQQKEDKKEEDDVASEPDIVQYRGLFDFQDRKNMKQNLENAEQGVTRKESKPRTSMGEENVVETDIAVDLATEAQQSMTVVKQQISNSPDHQQLVTVPVVEACEDANPVLNEDRDVYETHAVVQSLGNLQDVAKRMTDDNVFEHVVDIFEHSIRIEHVESDPEDLDRDDDDDDEEEDDNARVLSPIISGRSK